MSRLVPMLCCAIGRSPAMLGRGVNVTHPLSFGLFIPAVPVHLTVSTLSLRVAFTMGCGHGSMVAATPTQVLTT